MRAAAFPGLMAILGVLVAPVFAQRPSTVCPLSGSTLAAEFDRVVRLNVPASLHDALNRDDRFKAQIYGYMIGRRLATAPLGSPYRPCALALDTWFSAEFGRFSNEILNVYRAGVVGKFDALLEGFYGIDTEYMDKQAPTPPETKKLADERTMSLDTAMDAVCPTNVAPEFSQAWMTVWRWAEAEYNHGRNLYDRRWEERRAILGHAMGRIHRVVGDHPVRRAAFSCLSDQMEIMIRRVSEQTRGRFDVEREKQIVRDLFAGRRNDEVRQYTGVTTSDPATTYWAQLEHDTGVDLRDGSFREASARPAPVAPAPPLPPPPTADPKAAAKRCAEEIIKTKRKPEFARLGVMGDTKVWIDPFENILVFIPLGVCVPWDWNEFLRDHEEKETQYKSTGPHYKLVVYRSRTSGEWVTIGYYR